MQQQLARESSERKGRVLVIGLDAFETTVADALISKGAMPNLARLAEASAQARLDHGPERYTGQAWHQFSTGLHPSRSGRWSAIRFDPRTFAIAQPETTEPPFTSGLGLRTVVFDVPHFNLADDRSACGVANWGSHDAGVPRTTRPEGLWSEIEDRYGKYPAQAHIYGIVWSSADRTERMARELVEAVERRRQIARWLLTERLPDWDLAILALSELHSVVETMWHGWDRDHPLNDAPSARGARAALVAVYEAVDRLIGDLIDACPDATLVAFAQHGMGPNLSDTSAMILMAELMHRYSLGTTGFRANASGPDAADWSKAITPNLSVPKTEPPRRAWPFSAFGSRPPQAPPARHPLDWMPTARYRHAWRQMKAFAIPAYHDARIRLNVRGREKGGLVKRRDYLKVLDEIAAILRACTDLQDGRPLDIEIEYTSPNDPFAVSDWQADLVVRLKRNVLGIRHPALGEIGPVSHRRTGGHTGGYGVVYLRGEGILPGDRGVFSTFDVTPMIVGLALGKAQSTPLGKALLAGARSCVSASDPVA